MYSDKVKSSGIFIRANTMVSHFALILFGGVIADVEAQEGGFGGLKRFSLLGTTSSTPRSPRSWQ